MDIDFLPATEKDASQLTQISIESKQHWQYPNEWIEFWRNDLTVKPEFISNNHVIIARFQNQIIGYYSLVIQENASYIYMEHLWLLPEYIGQGLGKTLFQHATNYCKTLNKEGIELIADPNAKSFYKKMGMTEYDQLHSKVLDNDRILPKMRLTF